MSSNQVLEDILEAVLFASEEALTVQRMRNLFEEDAQPSSDELHSALAALQARSEARPVRLVKIGKAYRYQTSTEFSQWINKLYETKPPKLSRALLETLSIIAYQQPVTRGDIQTVRGISVSSDIMNRLLERGWVKNIGHKEVPGRPSLYGTTDEFLSYFSLSSLKDLPALKAPRELQDIAVELNLELPFDQPPVQDKVLPIDDAEGAVEEHEATPTEGKPAQEEE